MERAVDVSDSALDAWFESEGLMRYAVQADADGEVIETWRPPLLWLGGRDEDFVLVPNPDRLGYPGKPLREMAMADFNVFLYRWIEAAVRAGVVRCASCGRQIQDGDDLPDAETWDAIFIEKEIVAWMVVHFDCKKLLPKKLKGLHPFELHPGPPPHFDLSGLGVRETLPAEAVDEGAPGMNGMR